MAKGEKGESFEEVAKKVGLDSETTSRYLIYMRARWLSEENQMCKTGYAGEWAMRFKNKIEYYASDSTGQMILRHIDNRNN
jgi:hypothetical protein